MDQQSQRGRKSYNNGGRFNNHHHHHHHHSSHYSHHNHSRGASSGNGRSSTEYYSTASSSQQQHRGSGSSMSSDLNNNNNYMNQGCRPTLTTWRSLIRRQTELLNEKNRSLREVDLREIESRKAELLQQQDNYNNKVKKQLNNEDKKVLENKGENSARVVVDANNEPNSRREGDKSCQKNSSTSTCETGIVEDNTGYAKPQEDNNNNPSLMKQNEYENCYDDMFYDAEAERMDVNRVYQQRERKLDLDMQRFFQDVERQLSTIERRMVYDPRIMENELLVRDQQMSMFHQRVINLEEKNRNCTEELEYFRHLAQQLTQSAAQQQQQFEAEKEGIISKAKSETMSQLIRLSGNPDLWSDPFVTTDPKLKLDAAEYNNQHHPLLSSATFHAWVSDSESPSLQPMPTTVGTGIMSDLRDRYEDVKCLGYLERHEKTDWIMQMIRKIVMFYEAMDMRVYEEALSNQYISSLIWCPNDSLCPQKAKSTFAFGFGASQLQATEAALQHAYNGIIEIEEAASKMQPDEMDELFAEASNTTTTTNASTQSEGLENDHKPPIIEVNESESLQEDEVKHQQQEEEIPTTNESFSNYSENPVKIQQLVETDSTQT